MNSSHLPPDADTHGFGEASGAEPGRAFHAPCYVQAAPLLQVMQEQVDYLMDHLKSHAGNHVSAGCPDCDRLEEVRQCLLKPFS